VHYPFVHVLFTFSSLLLSQLGDFDIAIFCPNVANLDDKCFAGLMVDYNVICCLIRCYVFSKTKQALKQHMIMR
jgi:hypothetical protein